MATSPRKRVLFMYHRQICCSLLLCLLLSFAGMGRAWGDSPVIPLRSGDLIAFVGDSITQQHLFTRYTELLLDTTYPNLKLRFVNVGWGGRHAAHIVDPAVLERDLLRLHPDVVLINFGMNDGWYRTPPDPTAFTAYQNNMTTLVNRINSALPKARIVLLTPTMCDPNRGPILKKYNDTLQIMGNFVRDFAGRRDLPCIDLFGPMQDVDKVGLAGDPKFTLHLPDGVHPGPVGHWVIATTIANAFGAASGPVVRLSVDAATPQVTLVKGGVIQEIDTADGSLNFRAVCPRPPFSLPLEARAALKLPFVEVWRPKGVVTVTNLNTDTLYGVYLNDRLIGRFTGGKLRLGVEWTNIPGEDPLTERLSYLSIAKNNYRKTAWRNDDTGLATLHPEDVDPVAWKQMDDALTAMTAHADRLIFRAIEEAQTLRWRITPETALTSLQWETTGPYNYQSFDTVYDPEKSDQPELHWDPITANPTDGMVNLMSRFGEIYRNSAFYTRTRIYVPNAARLSFSVAAYGPLKVWVNGHQVIARDVMNDTLPPPVTAVAPLVEGWNTILLRETRTANGWGFIPQVYLSGLTPAELQMVRP